MKPMWEIVRDLEYAWRKGQLTPTYIDVYADKHGERVSALYAVCAKNFLTIAHEAGRNDHVLRDRSMSVDEAAVAKAMEDNSREMHRELRKAIEDGRPHALRKPTKNALFVRKDRA